MRLVKYILVSSLVVFSAVKLRGYLLGAEHFRIKTVEVRGTFFLGEREVEKLAGLERGDSLFSFKPRRAEAMLASDPWVKGARVQRLVPDRVVVKVEERRPIALVAGQGLYCLGSGGLLLPARENARRLGLPVIRGLGVGADDVGEKVDSFALDNLLLHMSGEHAPLRLCDLSEIKVSSVGYEMITLAGVVVRAGLELKESMSLLRRALDDAAGREIGFRSADARVEGQVILN